MGGDDMSAAGEGTGVTGVTGVTGCGWIWF